MEVFQHKARVLNKSRKPVFLHWVVIVVFLWICVRISFQRDLVLQLKRQQLIRIKSAPAHVSVWNSFVHNGKRNLQEFFPATKKEPSNLELQVFQLKQILPRSTTLILSNEGSQCG